MTTRERVIEIIAEQALLTPADVREDMTLADLGIDSLGVVESIYAIEEAFDLTVPFNANDPQASEFDVSTVGSIVQAVEGLVAERA
jgi:acyl carrier protein